MSFRVTQSFYLSVGRTLFRALVVLSLVACVLTVATTVAFGADEATETIHLDPGNNYVGWVSEPIAVADVFTQIPAADLIYTWDPNLRRYRTAQPDGGGSLETLEPGMAAMINIDGRRSVTWQRPLTPAKGSVPLYRGVNWVTWVGRDDWPLDQVARGIGTSLVSIQVGDETWPAPLDGSLEEFPTLSRGDALQVTVNRDLRWLQPTGMLPNVVWAGEPSQSLIDEITVDIRRTVDFFAETFAVETDFSETTLLLFHTIEAAVAHEQAGAEPQVGNGADWLRARLTHGGQASGWSWGFYMMTCAWQSPKPQPCRHKAIETLVHEWVHILQTQLAAGEEWRVSPKWMLEGVAMWTEGLLPSELHSRPIERVREQRLEETSRTSVRLQTVEGWNGQWPYRMGPVAVSRLVERSGVDSPLEFYRSMHPQITGKERKWVQAQTWHGAFETAFGSTVTAFYDEFEAWRETLMIPARRYDYDRGDVTLAGTLRGNSGTSPSGFRVNAARTVDGNQVSTERATAVDQDGAFSLDLAPGTMQRVWFTRDGCSLWLTDEGLTASRPQPGQHRDLDTRNLSNLELTLPGGVCQNKVRVDVLKLRDDDRRIEISLNSEDGQQWISAQSSGGNSYSVYATDDGRYRARVLVGGCILWYHPGGLGASIRDAALLELSERPVSIEARIPDDLCARTISGQLVTEDGAPVTDVTLWAGGPGPTSGFSSPDVNGKFTIAVPESGDYSLYFRVDGCGIQYKTTSATADSRQATLITVADSDVTGIEFRVPTDSASLCN